MPRASAIAPKPLCRFRIGAHFVNVGAVLAALATVAVCPGVTLSAQSRSGLAAQVRTPSGPVIEYAANESGGRIKLTDPSADSTTVEAIRVHLLENAAAIRRGDFRSIRVVRNDLPAIRVLVDRRGAIRCTVRVTAKGAELVLLSDDDVVVAAIHQLLSATPPTQIQL
jgi:hypothetical protein